ncbi:FG-GAP-like repeat-containing protein [Tunturiibacter gelidoferens]|uniref:Bacterial Ig-like domain-containing protein n=1 Tax=Tunturiibacter lichenicola TaxID=2051959 RepID=A0A7Y9T412_9BACT|nr:FG-GAP-like repeat-containing protein [Edaphobacter lichenicola]NYF52947.1 hypothetical protein [Edaphobacter lichenicola]
MTATSWFKTPSGARSLLVLLIAPFLTLPAVAQTQKPIYPTLPYNFALFPTATGAFGDFNGDGRIDEATPNGINAMGLRLNNGPASSPTLTSIPLSCSPQFVLATDLNNDNKIDLAFSCSGAYVGVMLGNGDGTFQTASYYPVPSSALSGITAVDLNGDGYLDIAVVADTVNVGVLLNQGVGKPGSLSSPKLYPAPSGVSLSTINAGDFNGDGKQDIIAGYTQIAIYYGNGDGTLNTPQLTTASTGTAFVVGDFNRDGLTDVAYLGPNPQTPTSSLQVLLGDSSGTLTNGSSLALDPTVKYLYIVPFQNTNASNITNLALIGNVTTIALNDGAGGLTLGESYGVSNFAIPETADNGITNLYFQSNVESIVLAGNGNGTFQGPRATLLGSNYQAVADLNADGLTDVLSTDESGNLIVALGRGDGSFTVVSRTQVSPNPFAGPTTVGDFNGDGKEDVLFFPGVTPSGNAQVEFLAGNGNGTFQPIVNELQIPVPGVGATVVGDFNGDGNLDIVYTTPSSRAYPYETLYYLAGNGAGNFAAPVELAQQIPNSLVSPILIADLNGDGILDIIWDNSTLLGNGDGTFNRQPLSIAGNAISLSDLNGDGKPDLVVYNNGPTGVSLYAGNGDGTFQTTPFYTPDLTGTFPYGASPLASIGDVNADGHPDLLLQSFPYGQPGVLAVFLGDGTGNFVLENTYPLISTGFSMLARLNAQAPSLPGDHTLDYVYTAGGATISLLNQLNPAPTAPAPLPSKTTLAASSTSAAPGQQLTLTATVTGASPTGTVSFITNGKALGTAAITNGTAALATSFAAAGTYPVIANYPGDANNTPSSSNAVSIFVAPVNSTTTLSVSAGSAGTNQQLTFTASVTGLNPTGKVTFASSTATLGTTSLINGVATLPFAFTATGSFAVTATYAGDVANLGSASTPVTVTVAAPDYTITASPSSATIKAGQSATTTLTVTPVGGYTGTVKFSCGTLPTGVGCTFAPSSVTPSSGAATSTLTITTTAPTTAFLRRLSVPLQGVAWASLLFLAFSPRRTRGLNRRFARAMLFTLLLAAGLFTFSGCSSSSPSNPVTNPGTPAGAQTITVTTADSSGNLSHAINFQVTVQ